MRRIDGVVGNRGDDPELDERIVAHEREGTLERVAIEADERKKSRLRVETDAGTDLGVVVGAEELRSGDVLFVDDDRAAIVTFEMREALVVELPDPSDAAVAAAVEFGHRVGNQHWDVAIEDGAVYVPVDAERRILEEVLWPYVPEGATTRYEEVDAELFVTGGRRTTSTATVPGPITATITPTTTITATITPTTTITAMSDAAFLTAMRFADSFLPVGTYTASYGVEQYINEGRIDTAEELGALVEGYLRRIVGPADTVALSNAHRSAAAGSLAGVIEADERLHAATLPAEFRASSTKGGQKLLELLRDTDPGLFANDATDGERPDGAAAAYADAVAAGEAPGSYPVALGVLTQAAGIDRPTACLVGAYAFVTELLGAAQRLGRFGHTDIQAQLTELLAVVETVCDRYADSELGELTSFAPLAETMGMAHERADRRLFMS